MKTSPTISQNDLNNVRGACYDDIFTHHMFVILAGTTYGSLDRPKLTFSKGVNLRAGVNKISLLSIAVGLPVRLFSLSQARPSF